ncbi:S26 family signal peptidase [Streptomyces yaizuensis]|uniref:S26 family signal peptidase n=1 Tax=Streptomyces yaizuensis TaxID=2989713 RepID=A0ABQ5PAE1_9ACTN|nr:S26 family signal peptidase [Streptomyces sp. YSPA8]GLF99552.1 S26 family signal peptidase [Streptomyces sp. YSPA8]
MIARLARRVLRTRLLAVTVTGPSMEPALGDGDRVLVRRRAHRVARGDIVVLDAPPGTHRDGLVIKRVAAAPGDPVPALFADRIGGPPGATVPPDCFLLLGDNRSVSVDSRHFGYVARARLTGVVVRSLPRLMAHDPLPPLPPLPPPPPPPPSPSPRSSRSS